ncbi:Serine/threonine-protein kinase [Irineochytrium annulatum]|nr:Serine/threonine-protein kinase [Irineochytrium annulatum]
MTDEDKEKLFAMKYYIFKSTQSRMSGLTTPHRTMGHHKSLSDASVLSDFAVSETGKAVGPQRRQSGHNKSLSDVSMPSEVLETKPSMAPSAINLDHQRRPVSPSVASASPLTLPPTTSGPFSGQVRPVSILSDSALLQQNRLSQDLSDKASVFSVDKVSVDMSLLSSTPSAKGKTAAVTLAVTNENVLGTIATASSPTTSASTAGSRPNSALILGSPLMVAKKASVVEAVAVATALGKEKAMERLASGGIAKHSGPSLGRRESTASSIMGTGSDVMDARPAAAPTLEEYRVMRENYAAMGPEWRDRNVLKLLEAKRAELFPPPMPEFGQKVNPPMIAASVSQRGRKPRSSPGAVGNDLRSWKPEGILAAHLTEHRGPINQIELSPDHNFFASCSDDGTVKIWDCQRLEKQVTNRARLTYAQQGGKILSVAFCESSHSVASVSDNGTIHVCRVEYLGSSVPNSAPKYNGIHVIRTSRVSDLDERDHAITVGHYQQDTESILVYGTANGKLCGLDLRSMRLAWSFDAPPQHGVISSFTSDRGHSWILTGTHRGVMSLWDIRFGLCVKTWAHPSRSRINRIVAAGTGAGGHGPGGALGGGGGPRGVGSLGFSSSGGSGASKMVMAAVGGRTGEVSMWDIEKGECREVWCVFGAASAGRSGSTDPAAEMDRLYGNGLKAVNPPGLSDFLKGPELSDTAPAGADASVRALVTPSDAPFMLTAGTDRRIRYWDMVNVEDSYTVAGLEPSDPQPRYSSHLYGDVTFNIEYTPSLSFNPSPNSTPPRNPPYERIYQQQNGPSSSSSASISSATSHSQTNGSHLSSSHSVINHLDAVTDMKVTQVPYPMILAGGRDGVIKVWI